MTFILHENIPPFNEVGRATLPLPYPYLKAGQMIDGTGLFGVPYFAVLFTD